MHNLYVSVLTMGHAGGQVRHAIVHTVTRKQNCYSVA